MCIFIYIRSHFSCLLVISPTKIGIQTCNTNQKDNQQGGGTKPANQMNLLDLSMPTMILWHAEAMDAMLQYMLLETHPTNAPILCICFLVVATMLYLVGGFNPMWKILVNWNHYSHNIWKNNNCSKPPTRYWMFLFFFWVYIYLILLWNPIFELCGTVLSRTGDRSAWNGVPQKSYGWSSSIFPDCIPSCSYNVVPPIISWFITHNPIYHKSWLWVIRLINRLSELS